MTTKSQTHKGISRIPLSNCNRPLHTFLYLREIGELYLDTPYQRGVVWGRKRQQNLIKSLLQGVPIPAIIMNCRDTWKLPDHRYAVIDGKQRITAILNFIDSRFSVPASWVKDVDIKRRTILFKDMPLAQQRVFKLIPLLVGEGTLKISEGRNRPF